MAAISSGGGASIHAPDFDEFQKQASLMTSCTLLWKELSDHFESLEEKLMSRSDVIKGKIKTLEMETEKSLSSLEERETSIEKSVSIAMRKVEEAILKAKQSIGINQNQNELKDNDSEEEAFYNKLKCFCVEMDSCGFWGFICGKKKELDFMREKLPLAFNECVDPAMFVLDAFSEVFPVDKRTDSGNGNDLGWACVLLLESLVSVLVDPVLGSLRSFVTPRVKKRAVEVAEMWKVSLEERGGVENVKASEVHTFLQHLVTFGIANDEDFDLYWKLVVGSAWRKQMPKLAVSLGLGDKMPDMIEELISRGQQVDAVHFTQEVGLVDKFPPHLAARKEQSALKVVIKCIEEYKLEAEFPSENLKKRLEQLEKVKVEKKRPAAASPANKRTRACTMGPMPPAKAGRITNTYVSSFPAPPPTYVRSPPANHYTAYSPEHSPVLSYPGTPPMNYPPHPPPVDMLIWGFHNYYR
ncbi:FRIGIDA-like protein 4a [Tanacetum coccineum]